MKSAIILMALAGVASADTRVYDVHATRGGEREAGYQSCLATSRMLKDRHVIKIDDDGNVTVNGFRWKALTEEPDLLIAFHNSNWQKTFLTMDLYVNQRGLAGKYILTGVQPDPDDPRIQRPCQDVVYIDGTVR